MINFDALTLKAFIKENKNFLNGASIKKIQQPSRRELIFQLRNNGENKKLYININPEFFHLCFVENIQNRGISIPEAAPMFCMLLRKYLQNSVITSIVQPFAERIIEFRFEYKDPLGEAQNLCLATELMGKYSNIILYDFDTKIILGCAHNVGEEKSKNRELAGTLPYIYPQKQAKTDILQENKEHFIQKFSGNFDETSFAFSISNEYFWFTIPLVKQILRSIHKFDLDVLFDKLQKTVQMQNFQPSIKSDFTEFSIIGSLDFEKCNSVNAMINNYFEYNQIQKILKQKKSKINTYLDSQIKKIQKQIEIFKTKLLETEKADAYRIKGDILMMNVHNEVAPKISLFNPYDGKTTEIELDTTATIVQNANRYYKLYKKTKTAIEYAENKIYELENQLANLEEQKFFTEIASSLAETDEISTDLGLKSEKINKKSTKKEINLETREIYGYKVFVGKNSLQNDYLLSKIAAPTDLWFHPLNMHGAHVILKSLGQKVPDNVLLACAKLAKNFSKAAKETKIPVIYTERKYVKKANSKLAFVTYKNEKEIYC